MSVDKNTLQGDRRIRVATVDDHPLMHQGIAAVIREQPDMNLVMEAYTGKEAIQLYPEHSPDVTLMDLRLPDMSGIDAMIAIRLKSANAKIIILTTFAGDVEIQRALRAGAWAYVLKSTPPKELVQVIRRVHEGKKQIPAEIASQLAQYFSEDDLTAREVEVLQLLSTGHKNKDVAKRLFITEETVKVHVKHIIDKLGATDRTHAVAIAVRRGFINIG